MTKRHSDQESAKPTGQVPNEGADLCDAIIDATTNTLLQGLARGLHRAGVPGGLRDSRALRAAIRQIVSENVRNMDVHDITKVASSAGLSLTRTVV